MNNFIFFRFCVCYVKQIESNAILGERRTDEQARTDVKNNNNNNTKKKTKTNKQTNKKNGRFTLYHQQGTDNC